MGPDLIGWIGMFMATACGVMFFLCFIAGAMGHGGQEFKVPERFDIGYYDPPTPQEPKVVYVEVEKPKKKKSKKKKSKSVPKPVKPDGPSDELMNDCVGALVSLGTKRGEARRVAAKTLVADPQITNVETFIHKVFQRN